MNDIVSLHGVSKRYGRVTALDGIDLAISQGTIFGVVGPNGAGKTSLIRLLVGVLRPDEGEVRVLGLDPHADRHRLRPDIGYMPQSPVLYDDLTAAENVAFFARGHTRDRLEQRVQASLEFTDLLGRAHDLVRTLSGGMRQRVSLAVALATEPRLLLLDEPTAGVDPELRHNFWLRFRQLAESGTTVVISTHQMDEVVHCDRVAILRSGSVLIDRTPQELVSGGQATVRVWAGDDVQEYQLSRYPTELPRLLAERGLDPTTSRIEVSGRSLEDAVLELIEGGSTGDDDD